MGLTALLLILAGLAPPGAQTPFHFAVIGDPQLGMTGLESDVAHVEQASKTIGALSPAVRPNFVVLMGDLVNDCTDKAQSAAAEAFRKSFQVPVYAVLGNHDAPGIGRFSFEHGGSLFLGLNSNLWGGPEAAAEEQWRWLETQLRKASGYAHVFVFQHHPLYLFNPDEKDEFFNTPLAWRGRLLTLLANARVTALFSGHLHKNTTGSYRGIGMLTTPSVVKNFDSSPLGFRLVRVVPDGYQETYLGLP